MAQLVLTPEHQIQRLNQILNRATELSTLPLDALTKTPHPKSWNVLEVLEHLSISYSLYVPKIEKALSEVTPSDIGSWSFKVRPWQRFVIEGQRPKGNKRRFKVKTLKRFEPLIAQGNFDEEKANRVFELFQSTHQQLKNYIVSSRTREMKHPPFSSAIGPIVKFYLPEAFEFLLCHAERHMVQIEEILATQT